MLQQTETTSPDTATEKVVNANGEPVIINRQQVYPLSKGKSLLLLSEDKIKRACARNGVNLLRKPYAYHTDRPEDVKCWLYGITGDDLIVVANDRRTNPEWEAIPTEETDDPLGD